MLDLARLLHIPRVDAGCDISSDGAPVQLICGRNDPRCPASDSLDARDKLVELGREVELILYEERDIRS